MKLITIKDPSIIVDRLERIREDYGDISELITSIKEKGQLVPILITQNVEGVYELVDGGRRRKACIEGKLPIEAVLRESLNDIELREFELEANLARKDLTWQERTRGIAELDALKRAIHGDRAAGRSGTGWSLADTAEKAGISRSAAHSHVVLAKAMEAFPELAEAKTADDAKKLLKKIEEKILLDELMRRKAAAPGEHPSMFANSHFRITDAFLGMQGLKSETFDFANVDTPYAVDLTKNKKIQSGSEGLRTDIDYTEWEKDSYLKVVKDKDKATHFEGLAWNTMTEVYRLLKKDAWLVWWFGIEWYALVYAALQRAGFEVDKIPCIWFGGEAKAQTMQPELYLGRAYDTFFLCRKGQPIMRKRGRINVFSFDKAPAGQKIHPTEKPLPLMQEITDTFVMPGSLCISPFLGSGNDLRAWYSRGCTGTGFELDQNIKNKFLLRVEEDIKSGMYKEAK